MEAKLIKTTMAEYVPAEFSGVNEAGFVPIGDRVLILPDQISEQSSGGVFLSEDLQERMAYAAETGLLIAVGDDAFTWNSDRTKPFQGTKPTPGTRIYFERYAGSLLHGADGKLYRIMDDKCVGAMVPAEEEVEK